MEKKHQSSLLNNGFFLGLIAGIALTLLFTTKKGRRMLRMLIDEGEEKLSELEKLMEQAKGEVSEHIQQIETTTEKGQSSIDDDMEDMHPRGTSFFEAAPSQNIPSISVPTTPEVRASEPEIHVHVHTEARPTPHEEYYAPSEPLAHQEYRSLAKAHPSIPEEFTEEASQPASYPSPSHRRFFSGIRKRVN